MEAPSQMCLRLIGALEDLAAQEAASLEAQDFAAVNSIQDRMAPIIELLVARAREIDDPVMRARMVAVQDRRRKSSTLLSEQIRHAREQLGETRMAQGRVARIAPVYGRPAGTAPRAHLQAVG